MAIILTLGNPRCWGRGSYLIVATLVIPSRQKRTRLEGSESSVGLWITNRRAGQDMGITQILVWATAAVGPPDLARGRASQSLSATAVSRFSHHQMPRFERRSIRLDVTGTGSPNLNTRWRPV
jgi:hypothetical protein